MIKIRVKATPEFIIVKNKSRQGLISLLAFFRSLMRENLVCGCGL